MNSVVSSKNHYIVQFMGMRSEKYGGLERFMIDLADVLQKENIYLILIYNSPPKSQQFIDKLKENKIIVFVANAQNPLQILKVILKIRKDYELKLFHSHFQPTFSCFFGMLLGIKERWVSLHTMVHNNSFEDELNIKSLRLKTRICRSIVNLSATRIFAVSNAARDQYIKLYPSITSKIETFYFGANENNFNRKVIREKLNFKNDHVYICCIAFALPIKGVDILIDAAKSIKENSEINNFVICLIGFDEKLDYTKNLRKEIIEFGLEDQINLLGIRDNIPELLKAMDIYCQPSRSEAMPFTLMEANMASLPLIGSNVGGIPEIINHNKNGFLFESENSEELASYLETLILDAELRTRMGKNAYDFTKRNFDRRIQIEKMCGIYREFFHSTVNILTTQNGISLQ